MLKQEEIEKIREVLEDSQNPLFFFDNDCDGLCSFLLLQRKIGRGKGVAIKSFPGLNGSYLRKIDELKADVVFILDKPQVDEDFLQGVLNKNLPVVWIDHHNIQNPASQDTIERINYFNSFPSAEPVTYISYKISGIKEDEWIALIGCISDVFKPEFDKNIEEKFPELYNSKKEAFDSLFESKIGEIVRMLNFGLKDTTTNVVSLLKFLISCKSPHDILEENSKTKQLHHRFLQLDKVFKAIIKKAEQNVRKNYLFAIYNAETSMSSEVSNALIYKYKKKFIFVGAEKQGKYSFSCRWKVVIEIVLKLIEEI